MDKSKPMTLPIHSPVVLLILLSALAASSAFEQLTADPLLQWTSTIDETQLSREERELDSVLSPPETNPPPKKTPSPPKKTPSPPKKAPPPPKKKSTPPPKRKSPPPPKKKSPPPPKKKKSPPPPKRPPPPKKRPPPRSPPPPYVSPPLFPPPYVDSACFNNMYNPCGNGLCIDNGDLVEYTCICPLFHILSNYGNGGSPTCTPVSVTSNQKTTVTITAPTTCLNLALLFRLSLSTFRSLNKKLNCNALVPRGTTVRVQKKVTRYCIAYYTSKPGDSCKSIAPSLGLTVSGLESNNPSLNCDSSLPEGIPLCTQRSSKYAYAYCKRYKKVTPGFTCFDLRAEFNSYREMFDFNPGLRCDRLLMKSSVVCVETISSTKLLDRKVCPRKYIVKSSDTCASIVASVYKGENSRFRTLNQGWYCRDEFLTSGLRICKP